MYFFRPKNLNKPLGCHLWSGEERETQIGVPSKNTSFAKVVLDRIIPKQGIVTLLPTENHQWYTRSLPFSSPFIQIILPCEFQNTDVMAAVIAGGSKYHILNQ